MQGPRGIDRLHPDSLSEQELYTLFIASQEALHQFFTRYLGCPEIAMEQWAAPCEMRMGQLQQALLALGVRTCPALAHTAVRRVGLAQHPAR